jgi:hypothetical protein
MEFFIKFIHRVRYIEEEEDDYNFIFPRYKYSRRSRYMDVKDMEDDKKKLAYQPFKLYSKAKNEPTVFEMEFLIKDELYLYGFSYNDKNIKNEYLYIEDKIVFEREIDDEGRQNYITLDMDKILSKNKDVEDKNGLVSTWKDTTAAEQLFLRKAMVDNCILFRDIYVEFFDKLDFHLEIDERISGVDINDLNEFIRDDDAKKFLLELYNKMDMEINNLHPNKIEEKRIITDSSGKTKERNFTNVNGMNTIKKDELGHDVIFKLENESNGIKSLTYLAVAFYKAFKEGNIVIVDEIENTFHNYVLNYMLKMFYNDEKWNGIGAQLIFTTHNDMIFKYLNLNSILILNKVEHKTSLNYLIDYKGVNDDMDRWQLIQNYFAGMYDGIPDIK